MLGPYTFLRLPIGIAGGIFIFHEVPDWLGLIGIGLIVASCGLALRDGKPAQALDRFAAWKTELSRAAAQLLPNATRIAHALQHRERPGERSSARSENPAAAP